MGGGAGWSHGRTAAAAAGGGGAACEAAQARARRRGATIRGGAPGSGQPLRRVPSERGIVRLAPSTRPAQAAVVRLNLAHQQLPSPQHCRTAVVISGSAVACRAFGSPSAAVLTAVRRDPINRARIAAANKVDGQSSTTKPKVARGDSTSDKDPGDKASAPGRAHRSMEDGTADAGQLAADQNVAIRVGLSSIGCARCMMFHALARPRYRLILTRCARGGGAPAYVRMTGPRPCATSARRSWQTGQTGPRVHLWSRACMRKAASLSPMLARARARFLSFLSLPPSLSLSL
eukprot:COSAG02_NODE_1305_length_13344_cov_3.237448_11_plen_289_part_01